MPFLDRLKHKKTKGQVDMDKAQSVVDALKIVEILKNSMYSCTMPYDELLVRFSRIMGLPKEIAKERLVNALKLVSKSQGISWHGVGSEISFSRTIPIVVVS